MLFASGARRIAVAACFQFALTAGFFATVGAAAGPQPGPTPAQAAALGKQAYDFGFPLLEFERVRREMTSVRCPDDKGNAPVNSFSNARGFPGPDDRTVVAPNTDTLYSISHLDLKRGPITLSWPRMGGRYYSFELLDPYTNVIDIPGRRKDGSGAGRVLIRWNGHGHTKRPPGVDRVISSKYRRIWVIGRTLATNRADQRRAHRLMDRYRLELASGRVRHFPADCERGNPSEHPTPSDGATFVRRLNASLARNPTRKRDKPIMRELRTVGIGPGLPAGSPGLDPASRQALYEGIAAEAESLPNQARIHAYTSALSTDGWYLPESNIGDYKTDYTLRAYIAAVGLGANTPIEAIYPAGIADSNGALYNGANDYRLTFEPGDAPPAKYFWSLTMYDTDGYLVPNSIDRYSLGPSHPPLAKKPDGSIVIAIQQTEPTESRVNWLPSPAGGFRLNLRLYGPSKAAQKGVWRPPGVVHVAP